MVDEILVGPNAAEIIKVFTDNNWVAEMNPQGIWIIGPEAPDGTINVLGMGSSFLDSFQMAKKCIA